MCTWIELVHSHRHTPPPPPKKNRIIYLSSIWYAAWLNCEKLLFRRKKHFQRWRRAYFTFTTPLHPPLVGHTHHKKENARKIVHEFFSKGFSIKIVIYFVFVLFPPDLDDLKSNGVETFLHPTFFHTQLCTVSHFWCILVKSFCITYANFNDCNFFFEELWAPLETNFFSPWILINGDYYGKP